MRYDFTIPQKMKKKLVKSLNHFSVNSEDADEGIILVLIELLKKYAQSGNYRITLHKKNFHFKYIILKYKFYDLIYHNLSISSKAH